MKTIHVEITLIEEMLGTSNNNPEIHKEFIASKGPNAETMEEEVAAIGADGVLEKGKTVFPKEDGKPFLWDYQIKGFFKDACGMLRKVANTRSSKIKAYLKTIDGLVFPSPRKIFVNVNGEIGECQRPLRAQTMQGERVALATSESIPAGSTLDFYVTCLNDDDSNLVAEWLDYGMLRGLGQWRNSGKGRFMWKELKD